MAIPKVVLEFDIDDLVGATLLLEDKDGEIQEGTITEIKKDLVKIAGWDGPDWIKGADIKVVDILFRD